MAYAQPIPLLDFRPDDDPRRPGVITAVDGYFPSTKGMIANPSYMVWNGTGPGTLPEPALGGISVQIGAATFVFVGTAKHLYLYDHDVTQPGAWVPHDTIGVDGYHGNNNRWRFAVFTSPAPTTTYVIAVNGADTPQVSVNGDPFIAMAPPFTTAPAPEIALAAPVAALVEVVDEGIFLANLSTGENQWIFSPNPHTWTPSVASEVVSDFLVGTPGPITAMHRIRGGIVMYKPTSMFFGSFTYPPFFWNLANSISETVGAANQELVVNTGDIHVWVGPDNFYQFDGSSLQPVPNFVKEWFLGAKPEGAGVSMDDIARIQGQYLRERGIIRWYYPTTAGGPPDGTIIYGVRANQKWLKCDPVWSTNDYAAVEALIYPAFIARRSVTYRVFEGDTTVAPPTRGLFGSQYVSVPHITYGDPQLGMEIADAPGAILTHGADHQLGVEVGEPLGGYWVTGELGDSTNYYQLSRIRVVYAQLPDGVTVRVEGYTAQLNGKIDFARVGQTSNGGAAVVSQAAMDRHGALNLIQTGVVQVLKFLQVGPGEVTAVVLDMQQTGME